MKPRLYIDADVTPALAELLRASGYDAISCHEIDAEHQTDDWHIRRSTAEGRILFSFNVEDFEDIARRLMASGDHHAGILVSHRQYTLDQVSTMRRLIVTLLDEWRAEDFMDIFLTLPLPTAEDG